MVKLCKTLMPTDIRRNKLDKMVVVTTAGALPEPPELLRPAKYLSEIRQDHTERLD